MGVFSALSLLMLLCFSYYAVDAESRTNFKLDRLQLCRTNTPIKFVGNVTTEKDGQYLTFHVTVPVPLDEHIGGTCLIESVLNNKTILPLFTINEKYVCRAFNKYMGEFWYNIIRAAQLTPGVCPIPAGRYHVHHVYQNYRAISLQTFPFGRLRFTWNIFDNRRPKEILLCLLIDVENLVN